MLATHKGRELELQVFSRMLIFILGLSNLDIPIVVPNRSQPFLRVMSTLCWLVIMLG